MKLFLSRCFLPLLILAALGLSGCDLLSGATGSGGASIEVISNPGNAIIELDGKVSGTSPGTLTDVSPGPHLLTFRKEGYRTVRRTVSLIAGEKSVQEVKLEPITGLVLLRSDPPGAAIELDGAYVGDAPILLHDIPLGDHSLTANLRGFSAKSQEFKVDSHHPIAVDVAMDSNSGRLMVSSTPVGGRIFVDGRDEGVSPLSLSRIEKGEHTVQIHLEGHEPWKTRITVNASETAMIDATLTPLPGSLKVVTLPSKARVYIDDTFMGEAPADETPIQPGSYALRVELRGHETINRNITIKKGEQKIEEFRLVSNSGTLAILTQPSGVKVYVDSEYMGMTRARGTDAVSEPLQIDMISHGAHTLQLVRKGYTFSDKRFMIQEGKVTTMKEVLSRQFIPNTLVRVGEGPNEVLTGVLMRQHPNGDLDMEVAEGIFRTIKANEYITVEPLKVHETLKTEEEEEDDPFKD